MTSVYINYPNPHFSVRAGQAVDARLRHEKENRRVISIRPETFAEAIAALGSIRFAATADLNDAWLEIDFADEQFERDVSEYVQRLIGQRYRPLATARWRE